jgi:Skp family chaperone for outer membrane proteins
MHKSSLSSPVTVFSGLALLLAPLCKAEQRPVADHQLAIAVVRTEKIVRQMQELKKYQDDLRVRVRDLQQQQQQRELELQDLQKHRDVNDKQGSQQWIDDTNAFDDKASKLEAWGNLSKTQLERWKVQRIKDMFDHLAAATAQVAEQQHLDLVIADQSPSIGPDLDQVTAEKLQGLLAMRAVLFATKKVDITEDVLTVVEANYARGAAASGTPQLNVPAPAKH